MSIDYEKIIAGRVQKVYDIMKPRISSAEYDSLVAAFEFAKQAHEGQKRLSGEPYILHPIEVALILADELQMGTHVVIAGFLHDVVEDTPTTIADIEAMFGKDVAFLVDVVTKKSKNKGNDDVAESQEDEVLFTPQTNNFRQMLSSINYDVRALFVKLADRLHNMRTLSSQPPHKQMKIAGETDFFYAPLANRLGLHDVKVELENLSFRYRCPQLYNQLKAQINDDKNNITRGLQNFVSKIHHIMVVNNIDAEVVIVYREPYSVWNKMKQQNCDFIHLRNRHYVKIIFKNKSITTDKQLALNVYSVLTDSFREKPQSVINFIDQPTENGYSSFHVQLMADNGCWEEVHITSERLALIGRLGCIALQGEVNIQEWIERLRNLLKVIAEKGRASDYMENVSTLLYNEDIQVFTTTGVSIRLPNHSTVLDFAFETLGRKAINSYYAKINDQLVSIKTELQRGDIINIFTNEQITPSQDWGNYVRTYKARTILKEWFDNQPRPLFKHCKHCCPIPGEEVIGFKETDDSVVVHKRDCPIIISQASQYGNKIVGIDYSEEVSMTYPVSVQILAVDRARLMSDVIDHISNNMKIFISNITTTIQDYIVTIKIDLVVRNYIELQNVISHISNINGVDEVKRI